jgi:hypothetical protein
MLFPFMAVAIAFMVLEDKSVLLNTSLKTLKAIASSLHFVSFLAMTGWRSDRIVRRKMLLRDEYFWLSLRGHASAFYGRGNRGYGFGRQECTT